MDYIKKVGVAILRWPLKTLYMRGPRLFFLWEGLKEESICYELTKVDSNFWLSSEETIDACSELIERKIDAFLIASVCLFVGYTIYTILSLVIYKHFFVSHVSAMIQKKVNRIDIYLNQNENNTALENKKN